MIINLYDHILKYIKDNNVKLSKDTDLVQIRYKILQELVKHGKLFNTNVFDHKLYPLVTTRGRPLISWRECTHLNCFKCFDTNKSLREHLTTHGSYTHGYSRAHEDCEVKINFNSNDNKYYCACGLCDFSSENQSDVEKHYQLLGIQPYYKPHEPIDPSDYIDFYIKHKLVIKNINIINSLTESIDMILKYGFNIFEDSECCVCMDEKSQVLLLPCKHKNLCKKCFEKISNQKCPTCKKKFDQKIKLNTDVTFYHP